MLCILSLGEKLNEFWEGEAFLSNYMKYYSRAVVFEQKVLHTNPECNSFSHNQKLQKFKQPFF